MLSDYDPDWLAQFEATADDLRRATDAGWIIEHIGSTAIPGMPAKPIIDLAVRVERLADVDVHDSLLRKVGFVAIAAGPRTHRVRVRLAGGERTHVAHFFTAAQWEPATSGSSETGYVAIPTTVPSTRTPSGQQRPRQPVVGITPHARPQPCKRSWTVPEANVASHWSTSGTNEPAGTRCPAARSGPL